MANHVTTEWEDIHVKLGNYVPTEKPMESNDKLQEIAIEEMQKYDPLENKNIEQLNELEDDEDDEVLRRYKEKRIKEMKEMASKPHYGKLLELKKQDYIAEVTNAPKGVYVVVHLYQNYIMDSKVLDKIFDDLAHRFILVKFMRIKADECIDGFKDKDVPAVIIYHDGNLMKQLIPASYYFGGAGNLSAEKVESSCVNRQYFHVFPLSLSDPFVYTGYLSSPSSSAMASPAIRPEFTANPIEFPGR